MLQTMISNVVSAIYPSKSGAVIETKKTYLRGVLEKAADDAITMNPDLMGKDFPLLQKQLESYAVTKTAKAILADLGDVANLMAEGNVARRIDNLAKGDISTFLQDVQDGRYPKLAYDIENLHAQMNDPLFERKKIAADNNRNQSPLGTAGLGYSPIRIQESFDDRYYGVIESHEAKTKELDELTTDIMTYRHNLLGTRTGSLPNRL
jgi:hypothetical protein